MRRLTPRPAAAVLGTLVFALHPLQAEAVAWASGFKDVLSGMLGLLAILLCLQTDRKWNTLAASSAFALALLAKPGAICAIPIAAVLLHFTSRFTFSVTARRLAVWCVLAIGALCIAQHVQQVTPIAGDSIALRPLVAADALAFYLWKFIWPFNLSSDYGRTPITVISEGWLAWTWVLPATAAIAVLMARRRIPLLMPAGLVGLCGISLMLGIVRFNFQRYSTVADHYTYLAMLGPAIAAAALIQIIEPAGVRIAAVGVTLLAIRCAHQVTYWRDNLTFFAHAVAVNPTSSMSHISYGVALGSSGELHGAISQFHQAIELAPASEMARDDLAFAHSTLASRFVAKGDLQGAVAEFRAALFVKPDFPLASEGLRQTLDQLRASTTLPAP